MPTFTYDSSSKAFGRIIDPRTPHWLNMVYCPGPVTLLKASPVKSAALEADEPVIVIQPVKCDPTK